MFTPQDLGLPHPAFRSGQLEMAIGIAESDSAHHLAIAPTGFGKTLLYMTIAALTGQRVVILTATKSLQDQLMTEFGLPGLEGVNDGKGLVDVRGQSNYLCNAADDPSTGLGIYFRKGRTYTVRDAPCKRGITCPLKAGGCEYYDRVQEAARAKVFVTNYDFWMHSRQKMGGVDWLVMDEAHQAPGELADFLSFSFTQAQRRKLKVNWPDGEVIGEWVKWGGWAAIRVQEELDQEWDPDLADLKLEIDKLQMLGEGEWVVEWDAAPGSGHGKTVKFDCINPEAQGRRVLWGIAKKVLLVSATVNLMTATALGIAAAGVKIWEAATSFPVSRRPVYAIDGAVRLNFRSTEGEKRMWVNLIDRIIDQRQDRKGILHTTSFERAKYFLEHSRHKGLVYLNHSASTLETVRRFSSTSRGILVSPSVTTGWDFPGALCEYQIIGKIPFPDLRGKANKVKAQRNKDWAGYSAAQVLVQASGRGMRSADDQCETFIVDGNFDWWWKGNRKFIPKWWQIALQWVGLSQLPPPPPKLSG